jgi:DNA-binding transcriptional ArsR family regulator
LAQDTGQRKWQDTYPDWARHEVRIPLSLLADPDLSVSAKVAYGLACYLSWRNGNGEAEVSVEDAAAMLGVPKRTLERAIAELRKAGLIESKRRGLGLTNAYIVHPPDRQNEGNGYANMADQETSDLADPRAHASKDVERKAIENRRAVSAPTAKTEAAGRKRDTAFDAMAAVTNSDPQLEGGGIAKAVNALRKHDAYVAFKEQHGKDEADAMLAAAITVRAEQYRQVFPTMALTPSALVRHWKRVQAEQGELTPTQLMQRARQLQEEEG